MSHDASVLEIKPEMVVFPRTTNDIRKVARFCYQLAEKGHVLPITTRGLGSDQTGAAIGKGIILSTPAHMNTIYEYEPKQKLVRVQPGVNFGALNDALRLHGVSIASMPASARYSTIGGAVANNASGMLSGKYGDTRSWVHQLEVVLSNGEVLQTGRISKRELNKRKGLQTFEGEIYRSLDNLIEDNRELIDKKINTDVRDNAGYEAIARVKNKKSGSFDLTPLFAGSQGTLGIISEMILQTDFVGIKRHVIVASFANAESARDVLDKLRDLQPALLNYYDGGLFKLAQRGGQTYKFFDEENQAVLVMSFDDLSERTRAKRIKKAAKLLEAAGGKTTSGDESKADELLAVCEVTTHLISPAGKTTTAPALFDGVYVPSERFEDFSLAVAVLAGKHNVELPLYGRILDDVYYTRPHLQLHKIGYKQKVFKLLDEYELLVHQYGGHLICEAGEGRLKSRFAYRNIDDDVLEVFEAVKKIFDPYVILNTGVKQKIDMKQLAQHVRSDYDGTDSLPYVACI